MRELLCSIKYEKDAILERNELEIFCYFEPFYGVLKFLQKSIKGIC